MNYNPVWSNHRGRGRGNRSRGRGWRGNYGNSHRGSHGYYRGGLQRLCTRSENRNYSRGNFRSLPSDVVNQQSSHHNEPPWAWVRNKSHSLRSSQRSVFLSLPYQESSVRPASPFPGTEEYMQRDITEKSAFVKRQLELEGRSEYNNSDKIQCNNNLLSVCANNFYDTLIKKEPDTNIELENKDKQIVTEAENVPSSRRHKRQIPKEPQKLLSVEEIHNRIINHISNLSYNKKINFVNQVGLPGYDTAVQEIARQKRLELSKVLRDICSNKFKESGDTSQIINSIIPDFDIKIEELPRELVEQLSSTLKEDVQGLSFESEIMFERASNILTAIEQKNGGRSSDSLGECDYLNFSNLNQSDIMSLSNSESQDLRGTSTNFLLNDGSVSSNNSNATTKTSVFEPLNFNVHSSVNYPIPPSNFLFPHLANLQYAMSTSESHNDNIETTCLENEKQTAGALNYYSGNREYSDSSSCQGTPTHDQMERNFGVGEQPDSVYAHNTPPFNFMDSQKLGSSVIENNLEQPPHYYHSDVDEVDCNNLLQYLPPALERNRQPTTPISFNDKLLSTASFVDTEHSCITSDVLAEAAELEACLAQSDSNIKLPDFQNTDKINKSLINSQERINKSIIDPNNTVLNYPEQFFENQAVNILEQFNKNSVMKDIEEKSLNKEETLLLDRSKTIKKHSVHKEKKIDLTESKKPNLRLNMNKSLSSNDFIDNEVVNSESGDKILKTLYDTEEQSHFEKLQANFIKDCQMFPTRDCDDRKYCKNEIITEEDRDEEHIIDENPNGQHCEISTLSNSEHLEFYPSSKHYIDQNDIHNQKRYYQKLSHQRPDYLNYDYDYHNKYNPIQENYSRPDQYSPDEYTESHPNNNKGKISQKKGSKKRKKRCSTYNSKPPNLRSNCIAKTEISRSENEPLETSSNLHKEREMLHQSKRLNEEGYKATEISNDSNENGGQKSLFANEKGFQSESFYHTEPTVTSFVNDLDLDKIKSAKRKENFDVTETLNEISCYPNPVIKEELLSEDSSSNFVAENSWGKTAKTDQCKQSENKNKEHLEEEPTKQFLRPWKSPGEKKFMVEYVNRNPEDKPESDISPGPHIKLKDSNFNVEPNSLDKSTKIQTNSMLPSKTQEIDIISSSNRPANAVETKSTLSITVESTCESPYPCKDDTENTEDTNSKQFEMLHSAEVSSTSDAKKLKQTLRSKCIISNVASPIKECIDLSPIIPSKSEECIFQNSLIEKMLITTYTQTTNLDDSSDFNENSESPKRNKKHTNKSKTKSNYTNSFSQTKSNCTNSFSQTKFHYTNSFSQTNPIIKISCKSIQVQTEFDENKWHQKNAFMQTDDVVVIDSVNDLDNLDKFDISNKTNQKILKAARQRKKIEKMFEIDKEIEKLTKLRQSLYTKLYYDTGSDDSDVEKIPMEPQSTNEKLIDLNETKQPIEKIKLSVVNQQVTIKRQSQFNDNYNLTNEEQLNFKVGKTKKYKIKRKKSQKFQKVSRKTKTKSDVSELNTDQQWSISNKTDVDTETYFDEKINEDNNFSSESINNKQQSSYQSNTNTDSIKSIQEDSQLTKHALLDKKPKVAKSTKNKRRKKYFCTEFTEPIELSNEVLKLMDQNSKLNIEPVVLNTYYEAEKKNEKWQEDNVESRKSKHDSQRVYENISSERITFNNNHHREKTADSEVKQESETAVKCSNQEVFTENYSHRCNNTYQTDQLCSLEIESNNDENFNQSDDKHARRGSNTDDQLGLQKKKKRYPFSGVKSNYKSKKRKSITLPEITKVDKIKASLINYDTVYFNNSIVNITRYSLTQLEEMRDSMCIKKNDECDINVNEELQHALNANVSVEQTDKLGNLDLQNNEHLNVNSDETNLDLHVPTKDSPESVQSLCEEQKIFNVVEDIYKDLGALNEDMNYQMKFTGFDGAILVIKVITTTVLAASDKGMIFCFDMLSGNLINIFEISKLAITSMVIINRCNTNMIYTGSLDSCLGILNFDTKELIKHEKVAEPIQCLESNWNYIFIGSDRGSLIRFDLTTGKIEDTIKISDYNVLMMKATQEGPRRVLIIATRNSPVCIRDAISGLLLRNMESSFLPTVYTLLFDKNLIYCGTSQHDILVYTFEDGQLIFKHEATKSKGVVCMQIVGNLLFAGCYNGNIYVYNTKSNVHLGTMNGPGGLMLSMEIVNNKIIVGTKSSNFKAWRIPDKYLNQM